LAMHIAKNYLGKEALVISGSKYTSTAEFYGHQVLSIREINDNRVKEVKEEVEIEFNKWVEENPQATEDDKNRAHDRILTLYNSKLQAGSTFSEFFLGPVYRAMQEGRPVIIDEINAIPHEILISLNNLLTRKVGDKVNIQQNTGTEIQVKDGFCVMATGNLNQGQEKYVGRQDMDPAFLSRFYLQKYDYLPQTKEGTLENEASGDNDLFKLILAKLMDRNGQIEIPQDSIKKLWKLAQAARLTQDVFSGKEVTSAYYYREAGGRPVQYFLKESVMSIRAIENILDQWQKDDYDKELDYYLWKEFISQSTMASDRAYLYQIFQRQFGFFDGSSGGWEQNPDYGSAGVISSFDIKAPENPSEDKKFFGPRDVVEFAFGKAPERLNWPDIDVKQGETTEQNLEELQELESWANSFDGVLSEIETAINEECQLQ
ncbi:AAA family ATPase, partial [Candidatus Gribaldobacteria bacterium]|nr:AAA family ATPase [Candidatus Gribaldobacteria bacterium]